MLIEATSRMQGDRRVVACITVIMACFNIAVFASGVKFLTPRTLPDDPSTLYIWGAVILCQHGISFCLHLVKFIYIWFTDLENPSLVKKEFIEQIVLFCFGIITTIWGCYVSYSINHLGSYYPIDLVIWFNVIFIYQVIFYGLLICCFGAICCCICSAKVVS